MIPPHAPVLLGPVLEALELTPGEVVVDATFGAGSYSRAFLDKGTIVVALDRDPTTQATGEVIAAQYPDRFQLVLTRFSDLAGALSQAGHEQCDAVALDVGVSSMQIDQAERGFSFKQDGPLDMRMGADGPAAADLVNTLEHGPLAHILRQYGDERQSGRIATAIVRRRQQSPFRRTLDLAEVVEKALGGRRGAAIHPATRTFQALRIAVNDELGELEAGLVAAERSLRPGGRLAVVSFHSLEDRLVKQFLNTRAKASSGGSRHLPPPPDVAPPSFELIARKPITASAEEIAANPRARSAKLRIARRTQAQPWRAAA